MASLDTANDFAGRYYTSGTLGFVPQIIYICLDSEEEDLSVVLNSLIKDMINEKRKFIENKEIKNGKQFDVNHPIIRAQKALEEIGLKGWKME